MAIVCDNCRKEIPSVGLWTQTATIDIIVKRGMANFTLKTFDLCEECQNKFKEYIGNFIKKEK
jgi:hypothetical protein